MSSKMTYHIDEISFLVLTDHDLWKYIVAFLPGLPYKLYHFIQKYHDVHQHLHKIEGGLPQLAIIMKDFDMLKLILSVETKLYSDSYPILKVQWDQLMRFAVLNKHVQFVEYLNTKRLEQDELCDPGLADIAIRNGDLYMVQWLVENCLEGCLDIRIKDGTLDNVANGHFELLKWLYPKVKPAFTFRAMEIAVENGHLQIVQYLYENSTEVCSVTCLLNAVNAGHLDVVDYLLLNPKPNVVYDSEALQLIMRQAVLLGDLAFIQRLRHVHEASFPADVLDLAAGTGRIQILEWLLHGVANDESISKFSSMALDAAACNGHFNMVQFLHQCKYVECTTNAIDGASSNGHLHIVEFLHSNRKEGFTKDALILAASNGHFEVVQFLVNAHNSGEKYNSPSNRSRLEANFLGLRNARWESPLEAAASQGHFNIVKLLHSQDQDKPSTTDAMDLAAANGHLSILKFLQSHYSDGPTSNALHWSAANGHLNVVKFLLENCHIDTITLAMFSAAENGHLDVVKCIYAYRPEEYTMWVRGGSALDHAAGNGHLEMVKFLHNAHKENVPSFTASPLAMDFAAEHGHYDVVKYLHQNRSEGCTRWAMDLAAANGHLKIVQYLHTHRAEGCSELAINGAAISGHLKVVRYLYEHCNQRCSPFAIQETIDQGYFSIIQYVSQFNTDQRNVVDHLEPLFQAQRMLNTSEVKRWFSFLRSP